MPCPHVTARTFAGSAVLRERSASFSAATRANPPTWPARASGDDRRGPAWGNVGGRRFVLTDHASTFPAAPPGWHSTARKRPGACAGTVATSGESSGIVERRRQIFTLCVPSPRPCVVAYGGLTRESAEGRQADVRLHTRTSQHAFEPHGYWRKCCFPLVPGAGVEPARDCSQGILSPLCLPFHHPGARPPRSPVPSGDQRRVRPMPNQPDSDMAGTVHRTFLFPID